MNLENLINYNINQWDYENDDKIFYKHGYYYDFVEKLEPEITKDNYIQLRGTLHSGNTCSMVIYLNDNNNIIVKMKYNQTAEFLDKDYISEYIERKITLDEVILDENDLSINSGKLKIVVENKDFKLKIYYNNKLYFATSNKKVSRMYITPGLGFRINSENQKQAFISWDIMPREAIFGLGEKFGKVNKIGTRSVIRVNDACATNSTDLSYKAIPTVLSTRNYSITSVSSYEQIFDIANFCTESASILNYDQMLELIISVDLNLKEQITNQTKYFGKSEEVYPPALGVWYSRCAYQSFDEMDTEYKHLKDAGIALDFMHVDQWFTVYWYGKYWVDCCDFIWNEEKFPNPIEKIKEYEKMGLDISTWVNPYLPQGTDIYEEAKKNNLLIKTIDGQIATIRRKNFDSPVGMIDLSTEPGREFYKSYLVKFLNLGIRSLKPDYADRVPRNALFNNGLSGEAMHNEYIYHYIKTCAEAMKEVHGDTLVWRRPGFLGTSKYPICWSGDVETTFMGLRNTIRGGLSTGFTGDILWSSDIGGFKGQPTPEVYIRWSQVGLLCSAARYHGTTEREPRYYGEEAVKAVKRYTDLRYKLFPYLMKHTKLATETGIPVMRHMSLENQNDILCREIDDQYYLGDSIIICPILETKLSSTQIYLPAGEWVCIHNGKVYNGLSTYTVEVTLSEIPVFVKKDSKIEVNTKFVNNSKEIKNESITYLCSNAVDETTIISMDYSEQEYCSEQIFDYTYLSEKY